MPMIGTIGNPAIVDQEPAFAIKNVALIKHKKISPSPEFTLAILNSSLLKQAIAQKSRGGTQKFLSLGDIRNLNCYIPSQSKTKQYTEIAMQIKNTLKKTYQKENTNLFHSLSQKAFRGKL